MAASKSESPSSLSRRYAGSPKSILRDRFTRLSSLLILVALLIQWGCAKKPVEWSSRSADDLLHEIRKPVSSATAISGSARITSQTPESLRKGRTYFALKAPNQLLLEAVTPSDETVAVLVTNADKFMGFEVGDARCKTGAPCAENVGMLFPIALDSIQIIRLLHGSPPLIAGSMSEPSPLQDPPRLQVQIKHVNGALQTIDFSPDGKDVIESKITGEQGLSLRIAYSNHQNLNAEIRIPRDITVEDLARESRVRIEVSEMGPFSPTPATFNTQCPVGKLIMPMDCSPNTALPR